MLELVGIYRLHITLFTIPSTPTLDNAGAFLSLVIQTIKVHPSCPLRPRLCDTQENVEMPHTYCDFRCEASLDESGTLSRKTVDLVVAIRPIKPPVMPGASTWEKIIYESFICLFSVLWLLGPRKGLADTVCLPCMSTNILPMTSLKQEQLDLRRPLICLLRCEIKQLAAVAVDV